MRLSLDEVTRLLSDVTRAVKDATIRHEMMIGSLTMLKNQFNVASASS